MSYHHDVSRVRILGALLLLVLSGFSSATLGATRARCEQTCPDDDEQGQCPPGCMDCTCCVRTTALVRTDSISFIVYSVEAPSPFVNADLLPPQPDLREVEHVPKRVRV